MNGGWWLVVGWGARFIGLRAIISPLIQSWDCEQVKYNIECRALTIKYRRFNIEWITFNAEDETFNAEI